MADIMTEIDRRGFQYRDVLGIPKKTNFGLELELDKVDPDKVYKLVRKQFGSTWKVKEDKSLTKGASAEIVSPKLQNIKETWILLRELGELLEKLNPDYNNCSFQVNFDGDLLDSEKARVRFLKLYAMYEDIIYKMSQGGDDCYRESLETYASPIILALKGALSISDNAAIDMFSNQKRYGVTFKTREKDLIEFRTPNMTSFPIYWQNYINVFYYLIVGAGKARYDRQEVDDYIERYSKCYILESYERENVEKAKQFAKVLLPSSTDKCNFMQHYLGRRP